MEIKNICLDVIYIYIQQLVLDVERSKPQLLEVELPNKNSGYFSVGESIVFQLHDWKLMELGKVELQQNKVYI